MKVPETEWPATVAAVPSLIKYSPSRRLGGRAPIIVHTGMDCGNPLSVDLTVSESRGVSNLDEARLIQELNIDSLFSSLDEMHRDVFVQLDATRLGAIERHNRKTHIVPYNPCTGDFVVIARMHGPRTKISANWLDPRRITHVHSDFILDVEYLLANKTEIVHISRVKPYLDSDVGNRVAPQEVAEFSDRGWHSVDVIKDIRLSRSIYEVLI